MQNTVPNFLPREELRRRLRPGLNALAFSNWLQRAMTHWGFPKPTRLGARSVAWCELEVAAWLAERPKGGRFDGKRRASTPGAADPT